jgi:signal transduction histidine kinase
MCLLSITFFVFQIFALRKKRKSAPSLQLAYLQYATTGELLFALGRFLVLVATTASITRLDQLPQTLILFTVAQMVMSALSYIAIGGYWAERIARESARAGLENEEIRGLLLEREGLIASLLKANKTAATGALSASIAHELNQPLGASALNIQFLQKKLSEGGIDPSLEKDILKVLLSDNQRAANIIKSLRAIFSESKLDAEMVDVNDLVDSVLQIAKPEIHSKNIQIVLKSNSRVIANVNRSEVQQVILNLINNAIQALEASSQIHRKISIQIQALSNGFEFSIADNGEGVSVENQPHLFELFSGSKKTGMGLGLWLCQHIVSRHGGLIGYEEAVGGGAQFRVFLPSEAV